MQLPARPTRGDERRSRRAPPEDRALATRAVMESLRRLVQLLRESGARAEARVGLSGAQLFVLHRLGEDPASSLNALAARTHTHQSSVSVVVSRLVERGLVARRPSADDARRVELSLTAKGRAIRRRAPETAQARMLEALDRMSASERAGLDRGLRSLVCEMGATGEAAPLFFEGEAPARPRGRGAADALAARRSPRAAGSSEAP